MPAKMPAAMRPENPVARIWAQYSSAMRDATSIRTDEIQSCNTCGLGTDKLTLAGVEDGEHISSTGVELSQSASGVRRKGFQATRTGASVIPRNKRQTTSPE